MSDLENSINSNFNILPNSIPNVSKNRKFQGATAWIPVFCANCGADGGRVTEGSVNFLFYLCDKCAETHGHITGTMLMPDEVFYKKMAEAQKEEYGRYLTPDEIAKVIEDDDSSLATLILKK